ncbi:MAG: CTP synthase [Planctomycetota bacterium]|nr:CTP synthase [Planctomycetota bacterium]MDI6787740.1 CTP synthase [Planctomycetota bacterium]
MKYIFVTGGVVSSLGKGLTTASIGLLLESRGLKVSLQKFDPYINVDAGTMNPFQHGEVYVTEDGAEADLDLGHYERFTNAKITRLSNYTTGKIYSSVIAKERAGEYLGKTVQVIPHVTNEIKIAIRNPSREEVDVSIAEMGGTVGDIESLPFLEAIRQIGLEEGRNNVLYIHLTLIPYLRASQEMKSKPTQQSVGKLREIGIQPDILICRTEKPLSNEIKEKLALFCNVKIENVIEEKDVDFSIYEVPVIFASQKMDERIIKHLSLKCTESDLSEWQDMLNRLKHSDETVKIAVVGKYLELQDSYKSIYEALTHGGVANNVRVEIKRVNSEEIERNGAEKMLQGVNGILVPGGFGERGVEGKILSIKYAREKRIPFFGICLGMQCATIEFARNVLCLNDAHSCEFAPTTSNPVIDLMTEQKQVKTIGGSMRLGAYPCELKEHSLTFIAYKSKLVYERHRHRYEFNNRYKELFSAKGWDFSGICPSNELVEIIELKDHPWFVGVQFHPEFKSKLVKPHPLFRDFIKASRFSGTGIKRG